MTPILAQRPRADRAFERLYRRHAGDVYRYALAVMRNQADAEDVTQTTFLNAYRAFQKGDRPEKAQNWLIAIAHNVCRQRFRQSARRPSEVAFDDDIADRLIDEDKAPSGEDIRRALGQLAFNQRAALVMRELEGRSYAEIAEILELSTSAVETLIFRARRALREQLETSLSCGEAELATSRQLDGRLDRKEKGALRAHLRQCAECARFARRQRAQRSALKTLAAVPLPSSLASFFGGGGAAVGTGLAIKAAVAVTAGVVVGGAGYEGVKHAPWHAPRPAAIGQRQAVVRDVPPGAGLVPAPREHMPPRLTSVREPGAALPGYSKGKVASNNAVGASPEKNRGRKREHSGIHGKPAYRGDASVAARHANTPARPARARPVHPTRPTPRGNSQQPQGGRSKPHRKPLPGPYDAGPAAGNGNGNGKKPGK